MRDFNRACILRANVLVYRRQGMSDPFVAVDTSLAFFKGFGVRGSTALPLLGIVHVVVAVAVAAFLRVVGFHAFPLVLSQLAAFGVEFLWGIDRTQQVVPDLI